MGRKKIYATVEEAKAAQQKQIKQFQEKRRKETKYYSEHVTEKQKKSIKILRRKLIESDELLDELMEKVNGCLPAQGGQVKLDR
ncbi:uncharacterized protein MONOS_17995 [Monocercomonoides exilis]|uniref:uncharacterized protein n=1 Tax=Monocercomonoides exilis TaxID=2049356 RepID=UPI0035599621|nr:hypothetical protein MONOS_17995 [Monocercomonoides exilis]